MAARKCDMVRTEVRHHKMYRFVCILKLEPQKPGLRGGAAGSGLEGVGLFAILVPEDGLDNHQVGLGGGNDPLAVKCDVDGCDWEPQARNGGGGPIQGFI